MKTSAAIFGLLVVPLLTALLFLVPSGKAHAQATRPFQMSLWECCGGLALTNAETDIHSFGYGGMQPTTGPSVIVNVQYGDSLAAACSNSGGCNWSQIAAVEVDEPYKGIDSYLDVNDCGATLPIGTIENIGDELSAMATQLTSTTFNPKARFWVNFTQTEAIWEEYCGIQLFNQVFNGTYIDVISIDYYSAEFYDSLYDFYYDVAQNPETPHQQQALIPGVFSAPTDQLDYLYGYISTVPGGGYAYSANQTCNLPLGRQGITGIYDGCPVWIVMGWMTGNFEGYVGITEKSSQSILAYWQTQVALTPVTPKQQARAKKLPPILQLLLQ